MRRLLAVLVLAFALTTLLPAAAFAADWFVATPANSGSDTTGDGSVTAPFATVQHAIDVASAAPGAPHRVYVGPGTYTGNVVMANGVSLYGAGAGATTLDARDSGSVVTFDSIGSGETISGFTITRGMAALGGGIYCNLSSPTISENNITVNYATSWGGGVACFSSSASITNNTFEYNQAEWGAGGIYVSGSAPSTTITGNRLSENYGAFGAGICVDFGTAEISGNTIVGNDAGAAGSGLGGGIATWGSTVSVVDNTITGNIATRGGGLYVYLSTLTMTGNNASMNWVSDAGGGLCGQASTLSVDANTLSGNQALNTGGGIHLETASGTITNNVMSGNDADYGGGALAVWDYNGPIANNTISGNTAGYGGGGLYIASCSPSITGNSISDNGGGDVGGAIWLYISSPAISNNIIARHVPGPGANGGALYCQAGDPVLSGNTFVANGSGVAGWGPIVLATECNAVIANCIIWGNGGSSITNGDPSTVSFTVSYSCIQGWTAGGTGNIDVDPLFADAPAGDYRLTLASPCIDTGTATGAPPTDIRGVARPQGAGVDMGAYEFLAQSVSFDSQGGSAVAGQVVDLGSRVDQPADSTRAGFTFGGWYAEAACTNAWDFAADAVTAPTTLYAKWILNTYSVSFDSMGGSPVAGQTVDHGSLVTPPTDPTRAGFTFGGWYTEAACTNAWDFAADTVTAPTTLYAKWTPLPITGMTPTYTMYVGDSLTIDAKPDGGTWSWDAAYFSATFNSPATFTALRAGSSVVAYTANGVTASSTITVLARPASAATSARTLPATGANVASLLLAALLAACSGVAPRIGARRA